DREPIDGEVSGVKSAVEVVDRSDPDGRLDAADRLESLLQCEPLDQRGDVACRRDEQRARRDRGEALEDPEEMHRGVDSSGVQRVPPRREIVFRLRLGWPTLTL